MANTGLPPRCPSSPSGFVPSKSARTVHWCRYDSIPPIGQKTNGCHGARLRHETLHFLGRRSGILTNFLLLHRVECRKRNELLDRFQGIVNLLRSIGSSSQGKSRRGTVSVRYSVPATSFFDVLDGLRSIEGRLAQERFQPVPLRHGVLGALDLEAHHEFRDADQIDVFSQNGQQELRLAVIGQRHLAPPAQDVVVLAVLRLSGAVQVNK